MNNQERQIVGGLLLLMLLLWLGFIWHRDPRFPGSFEGSLLGIIAALFMFVPLFYLVIKRVKPLKKWITQRVPMPKLLLWHVYAGVLGPILGLLHSAHRFDSYVGSSLIILMFVVVISGFIGRYLLSLISSSLRDKKALRNDLYSKFQRVRVELENQGKEDHLSPVHSFHRSLLPALVDASFWSQHPAKTSTAQALKLVDAISDVDYSIKIHDTAKGWFQRWLKFHIAISLLLYALLIFHIGSEIYFGLRWL